MAAPASDMILSFFSIVGLLASRFSPTMERAADSAARPSMERLWRPGIRSEEHTSELQSLMRISYAVFCLQNKTYDHYIPLYTLYRTHYYVYPTCQRDLIYIHYPN